jgi:DNA-binding NarL/FixJ family response regulator
VYSITEGSVCAIWHTCRESNCHQESSSRRRLTIPTVLIVDDHEIVRQGVRRILETQNDWEICGEAENGQEALRLSQQLHPDAIVMDITMPVLDGLEATKQITKSNPDSRVLILTMHERRGLLAAAQSSGAKGVLTKSRAADHLTSALHAILAGNTYFD